MSENGPAEVNGGTRMVCSEHVLSQQSTEEHGIEGRRIQMECDKTQKPSLENFGKDVRVRPNREIKVVK